MRSVFVMFSMLLAVSLMGARCSCSKSPEPRKSDDEAWINAEPGDTGEASETTDGTATEGAAGGERATDGTTAPAVDPQKTPEVEPTMSSDEASGTESLPSDEDM